MFIVVSLIAVFVMISIYLYFRAEGLQSDLTLAKRESKQIKKDNSALIDAMIISANKNEEFANSNSTRSTVFNTICFGDSY